MKLFGFGRSSPSSSTHRTAPVLGYLHVVLHRGSDLIAVDSNGLSDPYVKLSVKDQLRSHTKSKQKWAKEKRAPSAGQTKVSTLKQRTLNPEFEEEFVLEVTGLECSLHCEVRDKDSIQLGEEKYMGESELLLEKVLRGEQLERVRAHLGADKKHIKSTHITGFLELTVWYEQNQSPVLHMQVEDAAGMPVEPGGAPLFMRVTLQGKQASTDQKPPDSEFIAWNQKLELAADGAPGSATVEVQCVQAAQEVLGGVHERVVASMQMQLYDIFKARNRADTTDFVASLSGEYELSPQGRVFLMFGYKGPRLEDPSARTGTGSHRDASKAAAEEAARKKAAEEAAKKKAAEEAAKKNAAEEAAKKKAAEEAAAKELAAKRAQEQQDRDRLQQQQQQEQQRRLKEAQQEEQRQQRAAVESQREEELRRQQESAQQARLRAAPPRPPLVQTQAGSFQKLTMASSRKETSALAKKPTASDYSKAGGSVAGGTALGVWAGLELGSTPLFQLLLPTWAWAALAAALFAAVAAATVMQNWRSKGLRWNSKRLPPPRPPIPRPGSCAALPPAAPFIFLEDLELASSPSVAAAVPGPVVLASLASMLAALAVAVLGRCVEALLPSLRAHVAAAVALLAAYLPAGSRGSNASHSLKEGGSSVQSRDANLPLDGQAPASPTITASGWAVTQSTRTHVPLAKKQDGGLSDSHGSYQGAASVQRGGGSGKKVAVVGACLVLGALILYGANLLQGSSTPQTSDDASTRAQAFWQNPSSREPSSSMGEFQPVHAQASKKDTSAPRAAEGDSVSQLGRIKNFYSGVLSKLDRGKQEVMAYLMDEMYVSKQPDEPAGATKTPPPYTSTLGDAMRRREDASEDEVAEVVARWNQQANLEQVQEALATAKQLSFIQSMQIRHNAAVANALRAQSMEGSVVGRLAGLQDWTHVLTWVVTAAWRAFIMILLFPWALYNVLNELTVSVVGTSSLVLVAAELVLLYCVVALGLTSFTKPKHVPVTSVLAEAHMDPSVPRPVRFFQTQGTMGTWERRNDPAYQADMELHAPQGLASKHVKTEPLLDLSSKVFSAGDLDMWG